jgi:hypothetical protein
MRAPAILLCALTAAACTPEIGSGTYFCGPERFCPPEQVCDDSSFTCVNPLLAEPFSCPDGSQAAEPDDVLADARDLGVLTLTQPTVLGAQAGCIPTADDVDLVELECDATCAESGGRLEITARYPVAFLPVGVELLDDTGNVLVSAELCTPSVDYTGMDYLCIDHDPSVGVYYVRAAGVAGAPDCDGGCGFNRYSLDIKFLR